MTVLAPLLRPASWRLSPGAADVPLLRHLGLGLLLGSTLALWAWCAATWSEAWRLREWSGAAVLAVVLWGLGLGHAWWLLRQWWRPTAPLTLRWTGPVATLRSGEPAGGWRVDEWGAQPVDVSLIWDWQHVLLLRVRPWESPSRQAWIWLHDKRPPTSVSAGDVHRLRTLLCLPPNMTRPGGDEVVALSRNKRGAGASGLVASSRHEPASEGSGMNQERLSAASSRGRSRSRGSVLAEPLRFEDDFPATQVLERWQDDHPERGRVSGGRP